MEKARIVLSFILRPLIRFISKIGKPEPCLNFDDYWKINNMVREGYLLFSTEYYRLSNVLVKGPWTHAAVYVGDGWVFEAVPDKCRMVHLSQFVLTKDAIAVGEITFDLTWPRRLLDFAKKAQGKGYDFDFLSKNTEWYCSEAAANILQEGLNYPLPIKKRLVMGNEVITPLDLYSSDKIKIIFEKKGSYRDPFSIVTDTGKKLLTICGIK